MNIIKPSVLMRSSPSKKSLLETECLFGEQVEIFDENFDWVYCKLMTDNYIGWVSKKGLGFLRKPTHRVAIKNSLVYLEKNEKSNCLFCLPMGSQVTVENTDSKWAEVIIDNEQKIEIGYVPTMHLVTLDHKVKDWVAVAEQFEGTPYKWGGRVSTGIDCSALLQLSYQTYGEKIPRNTSQQIMLEKKNIINIKDLKRGCVIFWEGHVSIMLDSVNSIHANAFHMKTKTEPLSKIIDRTDKTFKIKKMMDFN